MAHADGLAEWDTLGAQWRSVPDEPPHGSRQGTDGMASAPAMEATVTALRAHVERRRHEMVQVLAGEVLVTLVALASAWGALAAGVTRRSMVYAGTVVLISALCWGFTIWNRRGTWRPLGESTTAYLRLTRRRAAAGRRSITFVRTMLVLGAVAWLSSAVGTGRPATWMAMGWWGYVAAAWGWSVWYARRLRRDTAESAAMERALGLWETHRGQSHGFSTG